MNYATIEEAWGCEGKEDVKKKIKRFTIASMRHPLLRKHEDPSEPVPDDHAVSGPEEEEPAVAACGGAAPPEDVPLSDAVLRRALSKRFVTQGAEALDTLLPSDYLSKRGSRSMFKTLLSGLDIDEIARWLLIAAIVYVLMDLTSRARS